MAPPYCILFFQTTYCKTSEGQTNIFTIRTLNCLLLICDSFVGVNTTQKKKRSNTCEECVTLKSFLFFFLIGKARNWNLYSVTILTLGRQTINSAGKEYLDVIKHSLTNEEEEPCCSSQRLLFTLPAPISQNEETIPVIM